MKKNDFTPFWMACLVLSPIVFSVIYFYLGKLFGRQFMPYIDYLMLTSLIAVVVVGGYQLYFWTQRNSGFFRTKCFKIKLDDYIPFWPQWVWIYSFLYYIMIGGVMLAIPTMDRGIYVIFGGLLLLLSQCAIFIMIPCINPPEWRQFEIDTLSKRFLKFVQGFDGENNCFPSMHCSLAAYISLTMSPVLSYYSYIFIALIAISCLFTKQHQILDVLFGVPLGIGVYYMILA